MSEFIVGTLLAWLVAASLLAILIVLIAWLPMVWRELRKAGLVLTLCILAITVLGSILRFTLVPSAHRVNLDEDRYLSYAVSFARYGKAVSLELASPQQSIIGKPDQAVRLTVPVINGLIMKVFGFNERVLFNGAKLLSTLTIVSTAVLAWLLFKKKKFILLSSTIAMAFMPLPLYWSTSIALDQFFMMFAILSSIAVVIHARHHSIRSAIFLSASVFAMLCVRLEAFAFLPILGLFYYESINGKLDRSLFKRELLLLAILVPLITVRAIASISVLGQKWCCADALPLEAFDLRYVVRNFLPNILFFITSKEFPFTLGFASFAAMLRPKAKYSLSLTLWFLLFFFLYSAYYAGKLMTGEFSGSYGRYFLVIMPAALLLAAAVYDDIFKSISKNKGLWMAGIGLTFVISFIPTIIHYRGMVRNAEGMYDAVDRSSLQSHSFVEHYLIEGTPANAIIVTNITALPVLWNKTSVYYPYYFENDKVIAYLVDRLKHGSRVFLIDYYECVVKPEYCHKIEKYFSYKPYKLKKKDPLNVPIIELTLDKPSPKTSR